MKKIPFHYEVRFKLISQDKNAKFSFQNHTQVCSNENPLLARKEAFDFFSDYVSFMKESYRIKKNKRGNYVIDRPSFVKEEIEKVKENLAKEYRNKPREGKRNLLDMATYYTDVQMLDGLGIEKFREDISVAIVIDSDEVLETSEFEWLNGKNEAIIHQIASFEIDDDDLMTNLELVELELYNYYKIDIENQLDTVYHYGVEFAEEMEQEYAAIFKILSTPHVWRPLSEYGPLLINDENELAEDEEDDNILSQSINFEELIQKGETNQIEFKSALLYNFKTGQAGIGVKYIIAKAICGFLNSEGGFLFIGVRDDKEIQGLQNDYSLFDENPKDKLLLELDQLIYWFLQKSLKPLIKASIEEICGKDVLVLTIVPSKKPVFLNKDTKGVKTKEFYIRMNASTHEIKDVEDIIDYVFNKDWK